MKVKDLIDVVENGSAHIYIYDKYGEVMFKNIWTNKLSKKELEQDIKKLVVGDYTLRIEV